MDLSFLPAVNASLNGLAFILLVVGMLQIKRGNITAHRNTMIAAFVVSCLFLVSYLTHYGWRVSMTNESHTEFHGPKWARMFYFGMLISHILLAMAVPVLAIITIRLGLKRQDARHRRIAKFTLPIWLYVSITGVLIYLMLYHLNSPAA